MVGFWRNTFQSWKGLGLGRNAGEGGIYCGVSVAFHIFVSIESTMV